MQSGSDNVSKSISSNNNGGLTFDSPERILGQGTFAIVYSGTLYCSGRPQKVAIKESKNPATVEGGVYPYESLRKERKIVERIARVVFESDHEIEAAHCLVEYYGSRTGFTSSYEYIMLVYGYANSGDLNKWILSNDFNWTTAYPIVNDITTGLNFLHQINIIHGDIKPENILLHREENGRLQAKISDFGLAKVKNDVIEGFGSVIYLAPEIFTRSAPHSEKSDIYALAVTLCEMAKKSIYVNMSDYHEFVRYILSGQREVIPNDCPKKIAHMITWGWAQSAQNRPTTDQYLSALKTGIDDISEELKRHAPIMTASSSL